MHNVQGNNNERNSLLCYFCLFRYSNLFHIQCHLHLVWAGHGAMALLWFKLFDKRWAVCIMFQFCDIRSLSWFALILPDTSTHLISSAQACLTNKWRNMCKSLESWILCSSIILSLFRYLEMTATLALRSHYIWTCCFTFRYRRQKFYSRLLNCPWVVNMTPREIFTWDPCP